MLESIPFDRGKWLNPPPHSQVAADRLMIETAAQTDFWSQTHYGFTHASGHALLFDMEERFASEVTFSGRFASKYEQAGLLLWESPTRWIKAGIEYADGRANLAVVVTDGRSDWSMAPTNGPANESTIRMTVTDSAVIIHARRTGRWQILRVANFIARNAQIGPMACSPLGEGLQVNFSDFRAGLPPAEPLYLSD
jgi:regulation of enolase protein 1 (concanavalin A-like superfamily)